MVPWGNRQSTNGTYSYPIPYLYSEGKYAIKVYYESYVYYQSNYTSGGINATLRNIDYFSRWNIDKINNITNNLYVHSYYGSGCIGLLNQNANHLGITSRGNGYAVTYQDNYTDKLEVRCYTTDYITFTGSYSNYLINDFGRVHYKYDKNGNAIPNYCYNLFGNGQRFQANLTSNNVNTTCSKSAVSQHYGFFPIFSPSEQKAS